MQMYSIDTSFFLLMWYAYKSSEYAKWNRISNIN